MFSYAFQIAVLSCVFALNLGYSVPTPRISLTGLGARENVGYITEGAEMPPMYANCQNCQSIRWVRFEIQPISGHDDIVCDTTTFTPTQQTNPWDVTATIRAANGRDWVQGGTGVLVAVVNGNTQNIRIDIRGTQPRDTLITTEIASHSTLWLVEPVARHESTYRQFDSNRLPLKSFDNGFGLYQLTNPRPTCQQVWSWKKNVEEGVERLVGLYNGYATNWMNRQRAQALEETGQAVPVPCRIEANCRFLDDSDKTCIGAVALKRYNGASLGNYCAWDNANARWKFNPTNNLGFNYVNRVCHEVTGPAPACP